MENKWKYVIETTNDTIDKVEEELNYRFPADFKEFILKNNAGIPVNNLYYLPNGREKMLGGMFSFNEDDKENIVSMNKFDSEYRGKIVAVAIDPFGNLICYDKENSNIVFWDHETDNIEYITDNWSNFIRNLISGGN